MPRAQVIRDKNGLVKRTRLSREAPLPVLRQLSGGGGFAYSIAGPGVSPAPVKQSLGSYTSRIVAYTVNLF